VGRVRGTLENMDRVEHLFVVRIWFEAGAHEGDAWRGSVEHVATGTRRYFAALDELDAFVARFAVASPLPRNARERS